MFITKKSLPRRTFLRGVGIAVSLPLVDAMVPALTPWAPGGPAKPAGQSTPPGNWPTVRPWTAW